MVQIANLVLSIFCLFTVRAPDYHRPYSLGLELLQYC